MAGHTILPWRTDGPDMFGDYNILSDEDALVVGAVVSNMRPPSVVEANAALIVRAVNSHEALVAALEEAQRALAMMIAPDSIKSTTVPHAFATATAAEVKARAALSQASA